MAGRLVLLGLLAAAPLAQLGAQLACLGAPARVTSWPAPLDREISLGSGTLSVREAIERAGAAARVQLTYSNEFLPSDRRVCPGAAPVRLGDVLDQWLSGTRLEPVVAGQDRVVLAPTRRIASEPTASGHEYRRPTELAPVVVVEEAPAAPMENATVARTVVTGAQLEVTGASSFGQALSGTVPGFWMWGTTPSSVGSSLASGRGASSFGASYPKVYVDGIEVANPLFLSHLTVDQVAQVEVIRGPQGSALFGAGAIGGVINITTRAGAGIAEGQGMTLRSTAGIASSAFSPLGAFVQDHALAARVGDYEKSVALGVSTSTIGAYIPGAYSRQVNASLGAAIAFSSSRLQLTARLFSQRAGNAASPLLGTIATQQPLMSIAPAPRGMSPGRDAYTVPLSPLTPDSSGAQDVRQYTLGATWAREGQRWASQLVTGVDGYRLDDVTFLPGRVRTPGDSALLAAAGGADRASARWSSVAQFGDRRAASANVTLAVDHSALRDGSLGTGLLVGSVEPGVVWRHTSGVTAASELTVRKSLVLNGGLRVERNSGFTMLSGVSALPTLGAAFRRRVGGATVTLRTAYGKAIQPSRITVRSPSWGGQLRTVLSLEPEEQSGVEFGADVALGSRFTARVTRFDQQANNLLQPVMMSGGSIGREPYLQLQNVGAISNRGWEMEGNYLVGALTLSGALGLTDSRVQRVASGYSGDLRSGDRVLQVPASTVSLTASWLGKGWTGSWTLARASDWVNYDWLSISHVDVGVPPPRGEALRAYWRSYSGVTRLRAAFTREITSAFGLVVSGENLLGYQNGEPDNVTIVPGRTVRAGLRAHF